MKLEQLVAAFETIAPTRYALEWDNVGLLAGDPNQEIRKVLFTIDYTPAVAQEARRESCDVVLAYHPPIFKEMKKIVAPDPVYDAIRHGVALYSPHTALDVAEGGTNDMLADLLGLSDRRPLRLSPTAATHHKLIVFVPEKNVQEVSAAMFAAGAGEIGDYSSCSFRSPGTGTFFGNEGTNPTVGTAGQFESAAEIRLETVVPIGKAEAVVAAMRKVHPYEEPAFDLVQLAAEPEGKGIGRVGTLEKPGMVSEVLARIKKELGLERVLVAGPTDRMVRRAAVCAGACGDYLADAIAEKADLYLTGEMSHHQSLRGARAGLTIVCALHTNSERAVLTRLARRVAQMLPGLETLVSQVDRDPFAIL